jgi:hypothetical protein
VPALRSTRSGSGREDQFVDSRCGVVDREPARRLEGLDRRSASRKEEKERWRQAHLLKLRKRMYNVRRLEHERNGFGL